MTIGRNTARAVLALSLAALPAACADAPTESAPFTSTPRTATVSGAQLARALAAGLGDAGVRAGVHAAVAASPLNEHKLVLGDFVRTPAGRALVSAAAARGGVAEGTLRSSIAALGETDFYLPVAAQRQAWRGEAALVGYTADTDRPELTAYDARGAAHALHARNGAPSQPLMILHPGEPKWRRGDALGRGIRTNLLSGGDDESCPPDTDNCEHPGTGGGTGPTATLSRILAQHGDGWGDIEIMIKHYTANPGEGGDLLEVWLDSGFNALSAYYPDAPISRDGDGQTWVKVWERDSGFPETGEDDFWGEGWMGTSGQNKGFGSDENELPFVVLTYEY